MTKAKNMKEIFITATDTDAGKTFVSCALIQALKLQNKDAKTRGQVVAAFKPVSAGCDLVGGELINEDAKLLCEFANANQTIQNINPIAFKDPIAPHIAAQKENKFLTVADIQQAYQQVKSINADVVLVEGAGGWRLPLGPTPPNTENKSQAQFLSDFAKATKLEVILIVNMKLGCLNHALLTFEAIKSDGLECVAWVANCATSEPMNNLKENITELEQLLPMPKIAQLDYYSDISEEGVALSFDEKIQLAAKQFNLAALQK